MKKSHGFSFFFFLTDSEIHAPIADTVRKGNIHISSPIVISMALRYFLTFPMDKGT